MASGNEDDRSAESVMEALKSNSAVCSIAKHTQIPIERVVTLIKESDRCTDLLDNLERENNEEVGLGKGNTLSKSLELNPQFRTALDDARGLLGQKCYNWDEPPDL